MSPSTRRRSPGSGLGSLATTTAGQDAVISLGGSGGYEVRSASNTLTGVMPGVSINLQSVTSSPVTVTVSADGQAASSLVQTFVTAANTVLQSISTDTAYDETTNTAGTLNGDFALQGLAQQVLAVVGQAIGTSTAVDTGTAGSAAGSFDRRQDGPDQISMPRHSPPTSRTIRRLSRSCSPNREPSHQHPARRRATVMSALSMPMTTQSLAATASS